MIDGKDLNVYRANRAESDEIAKEAAPSDWQNPPTSPVLSSIGILARIYSASRWMDANSTVSQSSIRKASASDG